MTDQKLLEYLLGYTEHAAKVWRKWRDEDAQSAYGAELAARAEIRAGVYSELARVIRERKTAWEIQAEDEAKAQAKDGTRD